MTNSVKSLSIVTSVLFALLTALMPTSTALAQSQPEPLPKVRFVTTEGAFVLQLRPDVAPKTVENFLAYVNKGFYEGTLFHRVIPGFMVQGGGFNKALGRKQTEAPIVNEATATLPNLRGTIAMARTNNPDSATSQFFINVSDNDFLNAGVRGPGYAVFGKVIEGMGVIDRIAGVKTGYQRGMADVPVTPVIIESAEKLTGEH
ncbi:peptidylprolyl isomerase [Marinobacter sp. VGCF2001]|uniref:peptidylprolyl isomerase n=1 Tax=Marinobacter sp. VGCF2001 TaxID=3417189 RepID=UPI003CF2F066